MGMRSHTCKKVDEPLARDILLENRSSHARRVDVINLAIRELGGEPSGGSGIWGAFARATEAGAKRFGSSSAVAALEGGEDHGLESYENDLDELSNEARNLVAPRADA